MLDGRGLWHLWRIRDMHSAEFWWANLKKRSHLKVLSIKTIITLQISSRNRKGGLGMDWSG
jgi:hypothetical protein